MPRLDPLEIKLKIYHSGRTMTHRCHGQHYKLYEDMIDHRSYTQLKQL